MTKNARETDTDVEKAIKGLKNWVIEELEDRTGLEFSELVDGAGRGNNKGMMMVAVAIEFRRDQTADFETLWTLAREWEMGDYESHGVAGGVDIELDGAVSEPGTEKLTTVPPSIDTEGAAS